MQFLWIFLCPWLFLHGVRCRVLVVRSLADLPERLLYPQQFRFQPAIDFEWTINEQNSIQCFNLLYEEKKNSYLIWRTFFAIDLHRN